MNRPLLIQVTPPGPGGVRDYLECLKAEWAGAGIESHVIELAQASMGTKSLLDRMVSLADANAGARGNHPATYSLLLHFSGYGYERRGLCFWLLREVEQAKARLGDRLRVVTMFHELFASGPPWRSAFWLSALQARIARSLACMSDVIWTNTQMHERWLREQVGPSTPITVHPVFCTIGEPKDWMPAQARKPQLVVFGSAPTRRRALKRLVAHAESLCRQGVTEVIEVGSGEATPCNTAALKVRHLGQMEPRDLGALLNGSAYGLIEYPPEYIGKSTVLAAYAAHGCVSLNVADIGIDSDGLQSGLHLVNLTRDASIPIDAQARETMATAARVWYAAHRLTLQADAFASSCGISTVQRNGID